LSWPCIEGTKMWAFTPWPHELLLCFFFGFGSFSLLEVEERISELCLMRPFPLVVSITNSPPNSGLKGVIVQGMS
jgi:hypothetical protein